MLEQITVKELSARSGLSEEEIISERSVDASTSSFYGLKVTAFSDLEIIEEGVL